MSRKNKRLKRYGFNAAPAEYQPGADKNSSARFFKFGDPEPALAASLADYLGVFSAGDYYQPPVSLSGLCKLLRANGHHGTIPPFRRNRLLQHYKSNDSIHDNCLNGASIDYDVMGNCFFQRQYNVFGQGIGLKHLPAINMRRGVKSDVFYQLQQNGDRIEFQPGEVVHLKEYDPSQQIYGIPQYFGGISAVMLSEDATLFRRKYFINGAHMGYILYTSDAGMDQKDEEAIKKAVSSSKGVGNFRSMYLNIPGGNKDSVQILRIGDIATKDEFDRIKAITRSEILAMWRMQAALSGAMPENAAGFGDIRKIADVYFEYETVPSQDVFLKLNEFLIPSRRIAFGQPEKQAA